MWSGSVEADRNVAFVSENLLQSKFKITIIYSTVSFVIAGVVYGFNVQCSEAVQKLARSKGVSVRFHNIIYKLMDDVREELTSRLPPRVVEEVVG